MKKYFITSISKKQASDSGMALVLIILLIGFLTGKTLFFKLAIPALLINMVVPAFYYPFAVVWLGISRFSGAQLSGFILTVIYLILVLPVGIIRKSLGKDPMRLKEFKKGSGSVMKIRNHKFLSTDIENPY